MKTVPHKKNDTEEVVVHTDTDSEFIVDDIEEGEVSREAKLKKLRHELTEARKERDEHLAGWQRARADLVPSIKIFLEVAKVFCLQQSLCCCGLLSHYGWQ